MDLHLITISVLHTSLFPFVCLPGTLARLHKAVKHRIHATYCPGARVNQCCQIRPYLEFCMIHDLEYKNPTPNTLCLYAEFLAQKPASPKSVRNYLSAIATYNNCLWSQATALSNFQYQLMLCAALPLTVPHFPSQKLPMTPDIMCNICKVCDSLGVIEAILKFAFTLVYFLLPMLEQFGPIHHSPLWCHSPYHAQWHHYAVQRLTGVL